MLTIEPKTCMLKSFILLIFLLNSTSLLAQSYYEFNNKKIALSVLGGINLGYTDYKKQKPGPALRGEFGYYLYPHNDHRIGVGFQLGYLQLRGEDDRETISTKDGLRYLPPSFSTNIFSPGFFADYNYLFSNRFSAFVRLGITYNIFNPKDNNGNDGLAYQEGLYNKDFFALVPESGIKFRINDNIDISLSANFALPVTDYLDDLSAANSKDSYFAVLIGFSYFFINVDDNKASQFYVGVKSETDHSLTIEKKEKPVTESDKRISEEAVDSALAAKTAKEIIDEAIAKKDIKEILLPGDETFRNGSALFKPEIYLELDRIIEILNTETQSRWRIEGHLDNEGDDTAIKKLSLERARAVFDYFTNGGIQSGRLRVYGLADNFPIGSNNTPEGRRLNRRIMIIREKSLSITEQNVSLIKEESVNTETTEETASEETFNHFILRGDDTFEPNTSNLNEVAKFLLGEIVSYLKEQPDAKWKIEGYMDSQGSPEVLIQLSTDRAKAVYDYLISQGLQSSQLSYEGLGDASPIANNNTEEGRSTNRRILIIREN